MKNQRLALITLVALCFYVLMLNYDMVKKNNIYYALIPLALIGLFSPAFLFVILIGVFLLLLLKSHQDFNPYFFAEINKNKEQ